MKNIIKSFVIMAAVVLSVAMFTACGGKEQSRVQFYSDNAFHVDTYTNAVDADTTTEYGETLQVIKFVSFDHKANTRVKASDFSVTTSGGDTYTGKFFVVGWHSQNQGGGVVTLEITTADAKLLQADADYVVVAFEDAQGDFVTLSKSYTYCYKNAEIASIVE